MPMLIPSQLMGVTDPTDEPVIAKPVEIYIPRSPSGLSQTSEPQQPSLQTGDWRNTWQLLA
jgi:hypothetical protein